MKSAGLTDSESRRAIEGIERNAGVQAKLITDLLDISQLIGGRLPVHMAATDLRLAVGHAVAEARAAAARKGLELDYQALNEAVPIVGDDERLQPIEGNLPSNALKFTPRGGHVGVAVLPEDGHVAVRPWST